MRTLIGCPTADIKAYCLNEYVEGVKKLITNKVDVLIIDNSENENYANKINKKGLEVIHVKRNKDPRKRICESRNILREKALSYDYLLSLEQDVVITKEEFEKMINHDKQVLATPVLINRNINGEYKKIPMIWFDLPPPYTRPELKRYMNQKEYESDKLLKIKSASLACTLIKNEVLEKVPFSLGPAGFDDVKFFWDLEKKNIPAYVDTSIRPKHYSQPNPELSR